MAKQTITDRKQRLAEGRCPIHGRHLHQAAQEPLWWRGKDGKPTTLVECCMCKQAIATENEPFGPAKLLPEFSHLLSLVSA